VRKTGSAQFLLFPQRQRSLPPNLPRFNREAIPVRAWRRRKKTAALMSARPVQFAAA
jgi:hypothetical protein